MTTPVILVPGSFDPPTLAHLHLFRTAFTLGNLVVGIGVNSEKSRSLLTSFTRQELLKRLLTEEGIEGDVFHYEGMITGIIESRNITAVLRGIRGLPDFNHELTLTDVLARYGTPNIWVPTPAELRTVSSSLARELIGHGDPATEIINQILPNTVLRFFGRRYLLLRKRFGALWQHAEADGDMLPTFENILLNYSDHRRHYHTIEHVWWALQRMDELHRAMPETTIDWIAVEWSIWFHDIILEGKESDETESAVLASMYAHNHGLSQTFMDKVVNIITATAHLPADGLSPEAQVTIDADLSILSASEAEFDAYEARVRQEWLHIDEATFRAGRLAILQRFVPPVREHIYYTPYARKHWEEQAQANLQRSMKRLASSHPLPTLN